MNRIIKAAGIVGITFVLAVLWKNDFIRFLLGFEVLVLLFVVLELQYLKKQITMSLYIPEPIVDKSKPVQIGLQVENHCKIPIPEIQASVVIKDLWDRRELVASGKIMLDGNEKGLLQFTLDSSFCGALEIRPYKLILTDHLGMFTRKCTVPADYRVVSILPNLPDQDGEAMESESTSVEGDGDDSRKGTSSLDISDIRMYQKGDSLRHIHWKLSARINEIMVRELSEPIEKNRKIYLNLYTESEVSREKWDDFLLQVSEVSRMLLQLGQNHMVIWYNIESEKVVQYKVSDGDTRQEMLCALLRAHPWKKEDIKEILEESAWDEKEEKIEISLQGEIIRTGEA